MLVVVHSVKVANHVEEDPEMTLFAKGLEKRSTSNVRPPPGHLDESKSTTAYALKRLNFISKADDGIG
ncbi:unnamed protein product [Dovyalis caffra]|uniref:Uncharacterized protein n=1 Tax=Dovyalis caffra TaxID=77055 RepID=A0AAV1S4W0_9ROSI|nr:unnamed protein product [Dovyalis caffra]